MAKVTRTSVLTGMKRTLEIPYYTQEDFERRFLSWQRGEVHIEDAFELVSDWGRMFIEKGITEEEYRNYTGFLDPDTWFRG